MKVVKFAKSMTTQNVNESLDWKDMVKMIDGRLCHFINLPKISKALDMDVCMVCDDEGKLKDEVIYNALGTMLYWDEYGMYDIIAGKVILLKNVLTADGIDSVPFSDEEADRVKAYINSKRNSIRGVSARMNLAGFTTF